jgi:hypothetical protein
MNTPKFTPGWPGMRYDVIPGKPDCWECRNTGYVIMHGAPWRRGVPRFDYPCECGRDPIQHLHDECVRKTANAK